MKTLQCKAADVKKVVTEDGYFAITNSALIPGFVTDVDYCNRPNKPSFFCILSTQCGSSV